MVYYAIYSPVLDAYLPRGYTDRSHTFAEFDKNKPPRLFEKAHHAETALQWWLDGTCARRFNPERESWEQHSVRIETRKNSMPIVVEVTLQRNPA